VSPVGRGARGKSLPAKALLTSDGRDFRQSIVFSALPINQSLSLLIGYSQPLIYPRSPCRA
jgi:hypothetical protein